MGRLKKEEEEKYKPFIKNEENILKAFSAFRNAAYNRDECEKKEGREVNRVNDKNPEKSGPKTGNV